MKIRTGFAKNVIGWVIKKQIKKNLGIDIDPAIGDIDISIEDGGRAKVHLELDLETSTETIGELVKRFI